METTEMNHDLIFDNDPSKDIPLKNTLAENVQKKMAVQFLEKKIKSFPEYHTLRMDNELLLYICNILHELHSNNMIKGDFDSLKIDKKDIVTESYNNVFQLSPDETKTLQQNIEFLLKHKKVKGIPFHRKVWKTATDIFFYLVRRLL